MRARRWFAGGGAALGILAIGAAIWGFGSSGGAPTTSDAPSVATAEVTRRTLVEQTELDGTLGYGDEVPLRGTVSGIVTWLPEIGAVVSPGQTLYRVDDQPVFLMAGMMPMYRELGPGSDGEDVEQLENGLAALGYDGFTVDGEYTARTAAAVREWQEDHGLEVTGVVDLGRVVFLPAAIRVAEVQVRTGDQLTPGTTVYDYTATSRVVIGEIAASRQELVPEGTAVEVELPDGTRVAGTVSRVASVAEASGDEQGQSDPSAATLRVTVTIEDQDALGELDGAPVVVWVEAERRENVLTVPVTALLALREGGYGVEVITETGSEIVAVDTGMFADGYVEISGEGITEGTVVGVAE